MPDWNSRLEVSVDGISITPIDSFMPTFNSPHTVIHSLEADNVGYVRQPRTFTFTMAVKAIGPGVAILTNLALTGIEFGVVVAEKVGNDWSFKSIVLSRCIITSANPSNVTIDNAPAASFNCSALIAEPKS